MAHRQSLRSRIVSTFTLFTAFFSLTIAIAVYNEIHNIDHEIARENLRAKLAFTLLQNDLPPDSKQQISPDSCLYYVRFRAEILPSSLVDLGVGFHEWGNSSQRSYVLVEPFHNGTIYLLKGVDEFEQRSQRMLWFLGFMVLFSISCSWYLSRWLAGKVISPVTRLADQVTGLSPQLPENFVADYADDEVGKLAHTFEVYFQRNKQYILREQEFTADSSHELRTPLAGIKGATELLLDSKNLGEREFKLLKRISRSVERMSQMLEVLLLLARETHPESSENVESCSIRESIAEVIEQYQFMLEHKNVALKVDIQHEFIVMVNKHILQIIIGNLLKNAIEHTEHGEVLLQTLARSVLIRDSGHGIHDEVKARVFERYRSAGHKPGSNGIGLSIVKRICDRYNWDIQLKNSQTGGVEILLSF